MLRYLLVIALAALPISSHAQSEQQRLHECSIKGLVFQMATTFRDTNWSPQYTFDYLKRGRAAGKYDGVDEAFIKQAVNLVYFDDHFTGVDGSALNQTITQTCVNRQKPWKPIK